MTDARYIRSEPSPGDAADAALADMAPADLAQVEELARNWNSRFDSLPKWAPARRRAMHVAYWQLQARGPQPDTEVHHHARKPQARKPAP